MPLRVLHLVGSASSPEFDDLSRLYARGCLEATADPRRYEPLIAHVTPDGRWRFPAALDASALAEAPSHGLSAALDRIETMAPDVMVPHMFCVPGMTLYRSLFELLGLPYVGNRAETMALTARKDLARTVVAAAGVRVPAGVVLEGLPPGGNRAAVPAVDLAAALRDRLGDLTPPLVVKPTDADNSSGLSLIDDLDDLPDAVAVACAQGSRALVEEFIPPGREVRVGLLERAGELVALPLEEYPVHAQAHPLRTGADKLARTAAGELALVAKGGSRAWLVDADDPVTAAVTELARRSHRALGCRHYSLFDVRIDPAGRPVFLEAGLYCSFSPQSVIATMAAGAGIPVDELFALMIGQALDLATSTVRSSL